MEGKEARQKLLEIFGSQIKFNKEFDSYNNGQNYMSNTCPLLISKGQIL